LPTTFRPYNDMFTFQIKGELCRKFSFHNSQRFRWQPGLSLIQYSVVFCDGICGVVFKLYLCFCMGAKAACLH